MKTVATPPKNGLCLSRSAGNADASSVIRSRWIPTAEDLRPTRRFLYWWEGVHAAADRDLKRFRKRLRACRQQCSRESVHELRVVTRRLVVWSDWIAALEPSVSPPKARKRLKALLHGLSRIRDCQVHQTLLGTVPKQLESVAREIHHRLRSEESVLSRRVRHRCRSAAGWFCRDIPRQMKSLVPLVAAIRSLSASRQWIRRITDRAFLRAPGLGEVRPQAWHRWRVALKRLRFAAESVGLCPGDPWEPRRLQRVLNTLGDVQDLDSFAGFLQVAGGSGGLSPSDVRRLLRWVDSERDQRIERLVPQAAFWRRALVSKKPVSSGRGAP
jgi:CHAD domain-containing protein